MQLPQASAQAGPGFTLALAQGKFRVGRLQANRDHIAAFHRLASQTNADLVAFPELALSGYPPQDLLFDRDFLERHNEMLGEIVKLTEKGCAIVLGAVRQEEDSLRNAAFLCTHGMVAGTQDKRNLPKNSVFDEQRYFHAGVASSVMEINGVRIGVLVCEDAWTPQAARELASAGAQLLLCLNASPFDMQKRAQRELVCSARAQENGLPLVYLNTAAAMDDLIFDGCSFVMDAAGEVTERLASFREDYHVLQFTLGSTGRMTHIGTGPAPPRVDELTYRALVFGLREFADANGYTGAVLGLSGGIDSALTAAIAVDAFGVERVETLFLPSPFTSNDSREDALQCAARLGIACDEIPIVPGMRAFSEMVGAMPEFITQENQTRIRASLLLALARKSGKLLLNTGNKSELATGFTTMYGDLCGHYAPLKDVYKTLAYRLAAWRNLTGMPIPPRIFHKPPSAELHPGQRDEDTLPAYPVLDSILDCVLERGMGMEEIVEQGHQRDMVYDVLRLIDAAEHKRQQAPPGPRVTHRALTRERRYPISNGWCLERNAAGKVFTQG